jgi:hypothetical protein
MAVFSLFDRDGNVRSCDIANFNAKTLHPITIWNACRRSAQMTGESRVYPKIGGEFSSRNATMPMDMSGKAASPISR